MLTWTAPEFEYRPKDVSWYWLSIILAVVLLALSIWQKNFLFGFFILVAEVLVLVWGREVPPELEFRLDQEKLRIEGRKEYSLSEISRFSVAETDRDLVPVVLAFKHHFRPAIRLFLPKEILTSVRDHLQKLRIPEVEHDYSLVESLENFLGF